MWKLTKQILQSGKGQIFDRQLDPEVFFTGRETCNMVLTETHRIVREHPEARAIWKVWRVECDRSKHLSAFLPCPWQSFPPPLDGGWSCSDPQNVVKSSKRSWAPPLFSGIPPTPSRETSRVIRDHTELPASAKALTAHVSSLAPLPVKMTRDCGHVSAPRDSLV